MIDSGAEIAANRVTVARWRSNVVAGSSQKASF
jgi:hypothetical protein